MPSHLIYSFARVGGMKTRRPVSRFSSYQGPDFRQESEAKRKLAFSSCLKDLACRLQIQDKIYSEITMARNGSIRKDQLNADKMLLLLATIYESARLVPAGSLLQRCSLTHDLNLKSGVTIPAGAGLVVPVQLVQMDDCSWGSDANEFNPYRFLSKPGKGSDIVLNKSVSGATENIVNPGECSFSLNDPNANTAFLPFGYSLRACIGEKFVLNGVATLFASLLEHYEIKLQGAAEDNPKPNNCMFEPPSCSQIVFVKRNS